jgi:hypothetical protein
VKAQDGANAPAQAGEARDQRMDGLITDAAFRDIRHHLAPERNWPGGWFRASILIVPSCRHKQSVSGAGVAGVRNYEGRFTACAEKFPGFRGGDWPRFLFAAEPVMHPL